MIASFHKGVEEVYRGKTDGQKPIRALTWGLKGPLTLVPYWETSWYGNGQAGKINYLPTSFKMHVLIDREDPSGTSHLLGLTSILS